MAFDAFMKVDGVEGDSLDGDHIKGYRICSSAYYCFAVQRISSLISKSRSDICCHQ
ncbi:hypothetical protein SAMN05216197_12324 [Pseudomonas graminis]|uniref:Uncharacterized protein n=1 Tax=Pseudomonas graminis TaxID=158627 RepID=A0A1I0GS07_9PSED|nr:hypothetical protein SAMN05216197_12324 [Pseudomonas graminis]